MSTPYKILLNVTGGLPLQQVVKYILTGQLPVSIGEIDYFVFYYVGYEIIFQMDKVICN